SREQTMNSPANAFLVLLGALTLLLAACGTGEDPTLLPEQTGPAPSLEALRSRATEATLALNEDRWLDFYEFKSPRSVRPRLPYGLPAVQLCTQEQFTFDTGTRLAKIRALAGLYRDEKLTWEIADVTTKEDRDRIGVVRLDIFHQGKLVTDEFHDYRGEVEEGERWVYIDGEWWVEPENWDEGCHENTLFGL
ncbi:MAG: hypothetical protein OXI33_06250, partial [Chloroflexota bacterium]|nr:hypothetical protein [Chloroflexota bacterium]